eukprot:c20027_g2_i2.p1 GENE.c20027_g2_i2~~c20027_g2_i2.p1  ORF type:complete len:1422 (+),score=671.93 c20027_g2_i2:33-4298(+)
MESQWSQAKHKYGVDDLTMVSKLTEAEVISQIQKRYQHEFIYTYIGPVLIAVNPFKALPIYTDKFIETYCGKYPYELPPHVYALAEDAYRSMLSEEHSQCIIISGESGAGKTETSKLIMQYIAAVSGNGQGVEKVKHIILESNPLLEAFGNAKTNRNNNSSRFGKFFQIFFNAAGDPEGGSITNYLLEKSRVAFQNTGERNFHIFYQICSAAADAEFAPLQLGPPSYFYYLNQSGTDTIDGVSDYEELKATKHAMDVIGISADTQQSIFRLLASILHLGNVQFVDDEKGHAKPADPNAVAVAAYYMQVDQAALLKSLTTKKITTGIGGKSEVFESPLNTTQASSVRDSLAKTIYDRIFDFIVGAINQALQAPVTTSMAINVLDIYGFEIFDNNGFEQFCINFVNEKLQQIFIELTLRAEQDEYKSEEIKWEAVEFFNNKTVCDLIEGMKPPGVFAILDDISKTAHAEGSGVDQKFAQKLLQTIQHPHFNGHTDFFDIKHYAGQVRYLADGFVDKNKDTIYDELKLVMKSSGITFLRHLFPEEVALEGQKKSPITSGYKIKTQAAQLVASLMSSSPHYIRCIKPNETKKPLDWDQARVQHQVKYLGILENIRVRRAGFVFRQPFHRFIQRYQCMLPKQYASQVADPRADHRALVTQLLKNSSEIQEGDWQLGKTKVFIRKPETLFRFEEIREEHIQVAATKIQNFVQSSMMRAVVRGWRYQAALLFQNKKQRRKQSLYRPFSNSDYARYGEDTVQQEFMKDYLEHPLLCKGGRRARTQSLYSGHEKILFSELNVPRLYSAPKSLAWESGAFYLSSDALYSLGDVTRKDSTNRFIRNRTAIEDIQRITLSTLSDNFVCIHVGTGTGSLTPVPVTKAEWMPNEATNVCMQTKTKFTITVRRSHCRNCGRIFIKECLNNSVMLKGFAQREKVCDSCYGLTLQEDQLFIIDHKLEFVFRLSAQYQSITGRQLVIDFRDSAQLTRRLNDDSIVQVTFRGNDSLVETKYDLIPPSQVEVNVSSGLPSSSLPPRPMESDSSSLVYNSNSSAAKRRSVSHSERMSMVQSHAVSRVSMRIVPETITLLRCRALFDYKGQDSDYLTISKGDIINITGKDDSGWWEGELNGVTGYFPSTYVEEIAAITQTAKPPVPLSMPPPVSSSTTTAAAQATQNKSNFNTPKPAQQQQQQKGANFAINDSGAPPPKAVFSAPVQSNQPKAQANKPNKIDVGAIQSSIEQQKQTQAQNQPTHEVSKVSAAVTAMPGFAMPGMAGPGGPKIGLKKAAVYSAEEDASAAEAAKVQKQAILPTQEVKPAVEKKVYCVAKYVFEAPDNQYISLKEGDTIEVTQKDESGWWEGILNGQRGYFPSNFVEICPDPHQTQASPQQPQFQISSVTLKSTPKPASGASQQSAQANTNDQLAAMLAKRRQWE